MASLFIDGAWVASGDGTCSPVINPSDASVVTEVDVATDEQVQAAIAAARRAFDATDWPRTPTAERAAALRYYPRTLLRGGRLDVRGRRCRLRSPLLRADWRLTAATGGEICRIAFRGRRPVPASRKHVGLSMNAADEPLLSVVILAASAAIVVHNEEVVAPLPGGSI